jgi:peroxiredoxin
MEQVQGRFSQKGLRVVAVNVDKRREDALKFLKNREPQITVVWDAQGITPKAYAVKAMPTSVLIGRDGKVIAVHRGFRPEDIAALERQVQLALQTEE